MWGQQLLVEKPTKDIGAETQPGFAVQPRAWGWAVLGFESKASNLAIKSDFMWSKMVHFGPGFWTPTRTYRCWGSFWSLFGSCWGLMLGLCVAKLGQIKGWKATSTKACWVGVGLGSILGLCCGRLEVVCWANLGAKLYHQRANVATTLFLCHCLWVT